MAAPGCRYCEETSGIGNVSKVDIDMARSISTFRNMSQKLFPESVLCFGDKIFLIMDVVKNFARVTVFCIPTAMGVR